MTETPKNKGITPQEFHRRLTELFNDSKLPVPVMAGLMICNIVDLVLQAREQVRAEELRATIASMDRQRDEKPQN